MSKRTTIACIALLATTLWACDDGEADMDAGMDAGGGEEDAGTTPDSGPGEEDAGTDAGTDGGPQIVSFGIRLSNMIGGLTPDPDGTTGTADDRGGAVRICIDTAFAPADLIPTALPYGGVSTYLPFPWGIDYRVTFYDAGTFGGTCPEDAEDPAALVQAIVTSTDVALGEFHTAYVTGWTAGGCTASGITTCPPIEFDIQQDDHTAPTAGQVAVRVVNGVTHASGPVDVCVVDMAMPTAAPIVLATGVAARDISTAVETDPIAGSTTTFIVVTLSGGTPCMGARVGLGTTPSGIAGTIPTNAMLTAASENIPATYDADTNIWLFLFPVGGGLGGTDPLAVPWVDVPDPSTLLDR